jgi:hypothetical protein
LSTGRNCSFGTDWFIEMNDCEKVDPANMDKYASVENQIMYVREGRFHNFLKRHQMWNKFLDEDAAGKR